MCQLWHNYNLKIEKAQNIDKILDAYKGTCCNEVATLYYVYLVIKKEGRCKEWDCSKGGTLENQNIIMKNSIKGDLKH
jgi:hypothetical protein